VMTWIERVIMGSPSGQVCRDVNGHGSVPRRHVRHVVQGV
jgi:hypothetical protein